jgi:hypothetical protein
MMRKKLLFLLWLFLLINGCIVYGQEQFPNEIIKDIKVVELNPTDCMPFNEYVQKDLAKIKKYQWWSTLHPLIKLDKFTLTTKASSTLGDAYNATTLCDGKAETAWVPGVKGGIGEWVKIDIEAYSSLSEITTTPFDISEIAVIPGYAKASKTWIENNRVKKLTVIIHSPQSVVPKEDEWVVLRLNLKDQNSFQVFKIPNEKIGTNMDPMKKEIWLRIEDIYKGTKYDDTCISEFVAVGGFAN